MTKAEFLQQYVLNRALTAEGKLDGKAAAEEAIKAWSMIESRCPELKPDSKPKSSGSTSRATTSTSSPASASAEPQSKPASEPKGEAAPKSDSGTGKP
jgi:hypothetical protein